LLLAIFGHFVLLGGGPSLNIRVDGAPAARPAEPLDAALELVWQPTEIELRAAQRV
jgi:hypothetical protein